MGKLLGELEAQGIDDETLVVLTADHAGQTAKRFHGEDGFRSQRLQLVLRPGRRRGPTWTRALRSRRSSTALDGNVDFTYQDGHIAVWLHDRSPAKMTEAALALADLPDVIATYSRNGDTLPERSRDLGGTTSSGAIAGSATTPSDSSNTMAAADGNGPDVVALLRDDTSYGVEGDHGGHQKAIQRIPIVFELARARGPGPVRSRASDRSTSCRRSCELMGIAADPSHPMDGHPVSVPLAP